MKIKGSFRTSNVFCLFDVKSKNKRESNFYTAVKEGKTSEMNHFQIPLFILEQSHHIKKKSVFINCKMSFSTGKHLGQGSGPSWS